MRDIEDHRLPDDAGVFINIAGATLADTTIADEIGQLLVSYSVATDRLMFEISEKIKDAVGIEEVPVEPEADADAEVKAADSSAGESTNGSGSASGNGKAGGRSGNGKRAKDAETLEIET